MDILWRLPLFELDAEAALALKIFNNSLKCFRCVIPTVFLSITLSALAGAGIFYLIYFFLVEFSEYYELCGLTREYIKNKERLTSSSRYSFTI